MSKFCNNFVEEMFGVGVKISIFNDPPFLSCLFYLHFDVMGLKSHEIPGGAKLMLQL